MDSTLLKEWYILCCVMFQHISTGMIVAFPAVLTPAITGNSTDIHATREQASWAVAMYGMTGPIGFLLLPAIMQIYGRKVLNIVVMSLMAAGSVIIAVAPDITTLIIGRGVHGLTFGGVIISCMLLAEYTHPKRRGFFIVFKIAATSVGEILCHGFGFNMSWRSLSWWSAIPSVISIVGTLGWCESPAYLAYQGRYEECAESFNWLRGKGPVAKRELRELISAQQELKKLNSDYSTFRGAVKAFRNKDFLKPCLIGVVASVLIQTCGLYFLPAYSVEIMTKLSGNPTFIYYYVLLLHFGKMLAFVLSSIVIRYIKRRRMLFIFGSLALLTLGIVCILYYLDTHSILGLKWAMPFTLILYYLLCNFGIVAVAILSKGEIYPLQYRGVGLSSSGIVQAITSMLVLKLTSTMLESLQFHGTFAIYLIINAILLGILYYILPETKDRTLQNIEADFIDLKVGTNAEDGVELTGDVVKEGETED